MHACLSQYVKHMALAAAVIIHSHLLKYFTTKKNCREQLEGLSVLFTEMDKHSSTQ